MQHDRHFLERLERLERLVLLEPRKRLGVAREQPIVAAPKNGRNERCPCGSGTKYKRRCGAGPETVRLLYPTTTDR